MYCTISIKQEEDYMTSLTHMLRFQSLSVTSQDSERANCPSLLIIISETKRLCPWRLRLAIPQSHYESNSNYDRLI